LIEPVYPKGGAGEGGRPPVPLERMLKGLFGFTKVRYRGLAKNLHRVQVTCALANLFLVRRRLLTG
jgi:hypothetical protein